MIARNSSLIPVLALVTALTALSGGCASRPKTIEIKTAPEVTALTPARERLSDRVLKADLQFLDGLDARAAKLPETSPVRAEAALWTEAARTEYLQGSRHPWVDQAAQHARTMLDAESPESAETVTLARRRVLENWITHVRGSRGFRSSLELIARAESLSAATTSVAADARPRDLPDALYHLQVRLAALHDEERISVLDYAWAKAQAWLDLAIAQHHIRDRSGIVAEASVEARELIELIEAARGREPGATQVRKSRATPALLSVEDIAAALDETARRTARVGAAGRAPAEFRADLWTVAESAPWGAGRARLEVALIHAAHERAQGGRASSRPYEADAERLAATLSPQPTVTP